METKLSKVYAQLAFLKHQLFDLSSKNYEGLTETKKEMSQKLQLIINDDMTFLKSLHDAYAKGLLLDIHDDIENRDVELPDSIDKLYLPVIEQLRDETYYTGMVWLVNALDHANRNATFASFVQVISLRLDRPASCIKTDRRCGHEGIIAKISVDANDSTGRRITISSYTELLCYAAITFGGFIFLEKIIEVRDAGTCADMFHYNRDQLYADYTDLTAAYRKLYEISEEEYEKVTLKGAIETTRAVEEVVKGLDKKNDDVRKAVGALHLIVKQHQQEEAKRMIELEEALEKVNADLDQKCSDRIIVGIVFVILLFAAVLTIIH